MMNSGIPEILNKAETCLFHGFNDFFFVRHLFLLCHSHLRDHGNSLKTIHWDDKSFKRLALFALSFI